MYVYHIRVNVNVGRVTRRMNPALIHVVVNVRVWVLVCNSNKNLKTLLRKKNPCEENNGGQRGEGD